MKNLLAILGCLVLGLNVMAAERQTYSSKGAKLPAPQFQKHEEKGMANQPVVLYKFDNGKVLMSGMTMEQVQAIVASAGYEQKNVSGDRIQVALIFPGDIKCLRINDGDKKLLCHLYFLPPIDEEMPLVTGEESISVSKDKPPVLIAVSFDVNIHSSKVTSRYREKYPQARVREQSRYYDTNRDYFYVDVIVDKFLRITVDGKSYSRTTVLVSDRSLNKAWTREWMRRKKFKRKKEDLQLDRF